MRRARLREGAPGPGSSPESHRRLSEQPKTEFQPIIETGTIRRLLFQCSKELAEATVAIENHHHIARMKVVSFDEQTGDFHTLAPSEADNRVYRAELEASGSKRCLFNVNMSRASLFFLADVQEEDALGFRFASPPKMFSAQRRKHMRLTIPLGYLLKAEVPDPVVQGSWLTRKVQDLSEGGMSFQAGLNEESEYASGTAIELKLTLKGTKLEFRGVVRHARPLKTREGQMVLKVGVEFLEPSQEARDHIARYIFDEQSRNAMR